MAMPGYDGKRVGIFSALQRRVGARAIQYSPSSRNCRITSPDRFGK